MRRPGQTWVSRVRTLASPGTTEIDSRRLVTRVEVHSQALHPQEILGTDHWSRCLWLATSRRRGLRFRSCYGKANHYPYRLCAESRTHADRLSVSRHIWSLMETICQARPEQMLLGGKRGKRVKHWGWNCIRPENPLKPSKSFKRPSMSHLLWLGN